MPRLSALHYIEMEFGEDTSELRPALVAAVHSFNARNDNALGLDFSDTAARVFGEQAALTAFHARPQVQRLASMCARATAPAVVPAVTAGVAVAPHRPASRQQPARLRRFEARNPGVVRADAGSRPIRSDFVIPMASLSTGQQFLLKVARTPKAPSAVVEFNSYGLCKAGSALPLF